MINSDKKYLMFIEPTSKQMEEDINDDLTQFAQYLESKMVSNNDKTRGWHSCACKQAHSSNVTYIVDLSGQKVITNSLLSHYVKNHRSEIPSLELEKLQNGLNYYLTNQNTKKLRV